ncbi:MAG TPA: hypothetical protein VGN70_07875 [Gammaproteobacteria bacterium]|jgi:hypothetical protein
MFYESKHKRPLSFGRFLLRVLKHMLFAQLFVLVSLGIGIWGYEYYEQMSWRDAFVNSAMLLGGMGPMKTDGLSDGGKVFAGVYALYAGLILIIVIGIVMAPLIHRIMHVFHWEEPGRKD